MGFFQARILESVAISFSRGFPDPGIEPMFPESPALAGRFFTTESPGKPCFKLIAFNTATRKATFCLAGREQIHVYVWLNPLFT